MVRLTCVELQKDFHPLWTAWQLGEHRDTTCILGITCNSGEACRVGVAAERSTAHSTPVVHTSSNASCIVLTAASSCRSRDYVWMVNMQLIGRLCSVLTTEVVQLFGVQLPTMLQVTQFWGTCGRSWWR